MGQSIEIGTGRRPPNYFETCRLRDHIIGNEVSLMVTLLGHLHF